jgi:hypothetical protein
MATPNQSKSSASTPAGPASYKSPLTGKNVPRTIVPRGNQTFLFDKTNYMWMIGGMLCILIGFALMAGGKSPDPHQFNYKEIYSFRRITLAPIVIMIGFAIEVYAIMMKRPPRSVDAD